MKSELVILNDNIKKQAELFALKMLYTTGSYNELAKLLQQKGLNLRDLIRYLSFYEYVGLRMTTTEYITYIFYKQFFTWNRFGLGDYDWENIQKELAPKIKKKIHTALFPHAFTSLVESLDDLGLLDSFLNEYCLCRNLPAKMRDKKLRYFYNGTKEMCYRYNMFTSCQLYLQMNRASLSFTWVNSKDGYTFWNEAINRLKAHVSNKIPTLFGVKEIPDFYLDNNN